MKKVVVVFGGASVEHDVSIITGLQAVNILKEDMEVFPIYLSLDNNFYLVKDLNPKHYFDKNKIIKESIMVSFFDNSLYKVKKNKFIKFKEFDTVLNACHGGVGENGELYAFLSLNKCSCTSSNTMSSSVCMNKYLTKLVVKELDIPVVEGVLVNQENIQEKIELINKNLQDNLIIKPNTLGSSIGVSKVNKTNLKEALVTALHLDNEILVENCIEDMYELNCSAFESKGEICLSLIEKVGQQANILSFEDKYCSKDAKREIPAKISKDIENKIYNYTKTIYKFLNLKGMIRIDFIMDKKNKVLYMNEINTVPGSLAFYLYEGLGINYNMLCESVIDNAKLAKKQTYFESDILSKTGFKVK